MAGKTQYLKKPNIFEQRRQAIDAASGWGEPVQPAKPVKPVKKVDTKRKPVGGY